MWCHMDSLILIFSMKQSRIQHDSGLCMASITLYFQHDEAAPHYAVVVRERLDEIFPDRGAGLSTGQHFHLI